MQIVTVPNPILKKVCTFSEEGLPALIMNLKRGVIRHNGLGLAAPQIGSLNRVFVMKNGFFLTTVIDPVISYYGEDKEEAVEGCLSIPHKRVPVSRSLMIIASYMTEKGIKVEQPIVGLAARIFQHEFDHLNGRLITND